MIDLRNRGLSAIALSSLFIAPPTEVNSQPKPLKIEPISTLKVNREVNHRFGHIAYAQAPSHALQAVTRDGRIRLRQAAARQFRSMQSAAQADGISLVPISGFRTIQEQESLFYDVAERRDRSLRTRAQVSAPPGHSEHHTGYAVDIGDGRRPAMNLQRSFEETAAFRWLQNNAPRYGFELSFPRNNL